MLSLDIQPSKQSVKSGQKLSITVSVRSTRDADVHVALHFPSQHATLTPHAVTLKVARKPGSGLRIGQEVLEATITGKSGWYTLTGRATDGNSESHDETLISVKA